MAAVHKRRLPHEVVARPVAASANMGITVARGQLPRSNHLVIPREVEPTDSFELAVIAGLCWDKVDDECDGNVYKALYNRGYFTRPTEAQTRQAQVARENDVLAADDPEVAQEDKVELETCGLSQHQLAFVSLNAAQRDFCVNVLGVHMGRIFPVQLGIGATKKTPRSQVVTIVMFDLVNGSGECLPYYFAVKNVTGFLRQAYRSNEGGEEEDGKTTWSKAQFCLQVCWQYATCHFIVELPFLCFIFFFLQCMSPFFSQAKLDTHMAFCNNKTLQKEVLMCDDPDNPTYQCFSNIQNTLPVPLASVKNWQCIK